MLKIAIQSIDLFKDRPISVKVASSQELLASSGALFTNITSALWKLPPSLQTYVDTTLSQITDASEYLEAATGLSSTTLLGSAGAILLVGALPTILSLSARNKAKSPTGRKNMSRYGWSSREDISPFSSNLSSQGGVPAVTDEDFSYITSEDLEQHGVDIPRREALTRDSRHSARSGKEEEDVLLIKHKGITYPEHFPPYRIGDGILTVADVIERVQITMQLPDHRARKIQLLYKGRQLNDPSLPVRSYGVKNNSEIMVVIPESGPDSSEDSPEEIVVVGREEDSRKKSKKKRKPKKRGERDDRSPRDSGSSVGLDVPGEDMRSSASRGPSPSPKASGAGSAAPAGPIEKLNAIGSHFTTKLLPLCVQFSANPPADPKKRADEHRKISETVMQQVILKLDGVETGGDEEARACRKKLVCQVQDVLKGIDEKLQG